MQLRLVRVYMLLPYPWEPGMPPLKPCLTAVLAGLFLVATSTASLASPTPPDVVIQSDHFQPATLSIAAGKRVKVVVANRSNRPAEFEGSDFTVEKVIPSGTTLPVYIGPLKAGTYHFFNDFSPSVKGTLTVK
ncbi:cupredoxin domain-containing protein [Salinisphaera sp. RV14]|uniref:cupredoxin domain-containing protein n=1 Tax=Salinisphaera sp. SWV1 TaxID=3454139 RepID=UPI003F855EAC